MRLGSMAVCDLLQEKGLDPIFQVTCRDRNRLALQADLLSASVLGIKNVLALTGDYSSLGDHPQAKPVFELDSVNLLKVIKTLEGGTDMVGNALQGAPRFCVGWSPVNGTWIVTPIAYVTQGTADAFTSTKYQDTYNNVTLTARVKRDGCDSCAHYIMLRGNPTPSTGNRWTSGYALGFASNGSYSVWECAGGVGTAIVGWTSSTAINPNETYNVVPAKAIGSQLTLIINGVQVWTGTDSTYTSG